MSNNKVETLSECVCGEVAGIDDEYQHVSLTQLQQDIKSLNEEVHTILHNGYRAAVTSILGERYPNPYPTQGKTKPNTLTKPHHRKRQR